MKNKYITLLTFIIIMMLTGISDSLRGIFIPIFQNTFQLNATQASLIITISYIGNFLILLFGGYFIDKYNHKTVIMGILCIWMGALVIFITTNNYYCLLFGMFFCMGASTLLSTSVNIVAPVLFMNTPGFIVNVLGFTQGIGTSGSQNIIGNYVQDISSWKIINCGLLITGILAFIVLIFISLPEKKNKQKEKVDYKTIIQNNTFIYFVFIFGFYFIAEHGILNWLVTYANKQLGYSMRQSSMYLSIFFGGITLGRLILSPLVDKLGVFKSVSISAGLGGILYTVGVVLGKNFIILLSLSGICVSTIYPTLVFMIRKFYPFEIIATATGVILSISTLFDVTFNLFFGIMIDVFGFHRSFFILPLSMIAFCLSYFLFRKNIPSK
ncbi:MAG: MFS transporter [Epulopiscium sp.]|nr:MFS transporter [Candidatus Epulonipiscium sp.]